MMTVKEWIKEEAELAKEEGIQIGLERGLEQGRRESAEQLAKREQQLAEIVAENEKLKAMLGM